MRELLFINQGFREGIQKALLTLIILLLIGLFTGICFNLTWEAVLQETGSFTPDMGRGHLLQTVVKGVFLIGFAGEIVIFKERQIGRGPP